ncbi:hypothetical protein [Escherichia coli]|uniref:hypothetical protein n=1 Tax=Escherichia coli TaxID=562 RepID=UPI000DDA6EFD|nr:hypothetical protein [Escherichia coli]EHD2967488.1 hypothetical protein [Escherichia coli]TGG83683.1 hypothetical protein DAH17_04730 [Escherichia coli]HCJ5986981.1 hypothetical protein [Escherichia coli]HCO5073063.1 hypothetical protein [Escherichia coli]
MRPATPSLLISFGQGAENNAEHRKTPSLKPSVPDSPIWLAVINVTHFSRLKAAFYRLDRGG